MTEDAAGRWPALLTLCNPDATVGAPRVCQGARIFEVVAACAKCGVRQTFRGTVQEIGDEAEVWQRGHLCAARLGEAGSAVFEERETGPNMGD